MGTSSRPAHRYGSTGSVTGAVKYRLFRQADLAGVLRLWETAPGWGAITADKWKRWYVDVPYGPGLVALAVTETEEVVGQMVFSRTMVRVGDREVRALRISAPILDPRIRHQSVRDPSYPVIQLYEVVARAARDEGVSLIYSLPEHSWLPLFRWGRRVGGPLWDFADTEYGCVELPLARWRSQALRVIEVEAARVHEPAAGFDELWRDGSKCLAQLCSVTRPPEWVAFKNRGHDWLEIRDRRSGSLVGYSAVKRQSGLLADIFARTPSQTADVLQGTLRWFADRELSGGTVKALKAMETPVLRDALRDVGFEPVDFMFAFVCCSLDAELPRESIAPDRWYLTAGD
ncbi:MAG: hypothetical protein M3Q09_04570 [Gemmatimonadota bacterium]|nr:hypothetical protein [Gemmatimonadota bacterium]